jgi:hypothetical protein
MTLRRGFHFAVINWLSEDEERVCNMVKKMREREGESISYWDMWRLHLLLALL